ncbi:MAG TPA: SCO1664 family protein [Microthrixaceae bacterium]|nr:SCO1664 family protein [Microthrixaceae bacterium]
MTDEDKSQYTYQASLAPGDPAVVDLLLAGEVEIRGLMPWSSNGTYLVDVTHGEDFAPAIYKPEQGEQPLWDFPGGLWRREVAAYELSTAMGLGLVPPTVAKLTAPYGRGSLQAFIPAQFQEHYFTIREDPDLAQPLRTLCAFDLVANSADRKSGHCLVDADKRLWAIDNGLSFHEEFKVRTVLWDYAGEPLPQSVAAALGDLLEAGAPDALLDLLTQAEALAMLTRAERLLSGGYFPHDLTGRRYPWPLV